MPVEATDIRDTEAALIRLVVIHAAIVALPVIAITALVGLHLVIALVVGLLAGVGLTVWRIRRIDDRLRRAVGAVPVSASDAPRLHNLAESVAMATGVASPQLHLIEDPARNAVVWGTTDEAVSFAITRGLLDALDRVELEAVLAYELAMARDGLDLLSVAAGLFGPLARGPLEGPIASLVHANVDDRRIVLADLESAQATCFPPGLVGALVAIRDGDTRLVSVPEALAPLFFASPVDPDSRFAVHPPVADRIDLVREL